MIKKLKRRFILVNMSILTSILLGVLTAVFLMMYHSEVRMSNQILDSIIHNYEIETRKQTPNAEVATEQTALAENRVSESEALPLWGEMPGDWWQAPENTSTQPLPDIYDFYRYGHWFPIPPSGDDFSRPDRPDDPYAPPAMTTAPEGKPPTTQPTVPGTQPAAQTTPPAIVTTVTQTAATQPPAVEPQSPPQTAATQPPAQAPAASESQAVTTAPDPLPQTTAPVTTTDRLVPPPLPEEHPIVTDSSFIRSTIYVTLDDNDAITDITAKYTDSSDMDAVRQAVERILASGAKEGKVSVGEVSYRYRFLPGGASKSAGLILLDRSVEISTMSRLLFIFIIIGGFGLLCIFGISVLLANWTVKPIALAWDQQKRFVADASHELKTPLAVICANTDVVLANAGESVQSQSKWLHYIKDETERMTKLVTNLLFIAKSDAKTANPTMQPFDLSDLVDSVCLVFEPIFFEDQKTMETMIQEGVNLVGDCDRIKQLLTILLDNAVQHAAEHANVTVSLSQDTQGKIRIAVSNTGNPIPAEQLSKLFDRFYRLDESRAKGTGGSGLGLNIAKTIVESHGGTIAAYSENGIISFVATL